MKKLLIICLFLFPAVGFSQDTIPTQKVLVCHQLINAKNGKVMRQWWRKVKVKSGYIIKRTDGLFVINGKIMVPNNFSYMPQKMIAKTNGNE